MKRLLLLVLAGNAYSQTGHFPTWYVTNANSAIAPANGWVLVFSNTVPVWTRNGGALTNLTGPSSFQYWNTNAADGSITNVNGVGGNLEINTNTISIPFAGYGIAANDWLNPLSLGFGNSDSSALQWNFFWSNNTNTDGSINTVFRRGPNIGILSGVMVPREGSIFEQMEFHYVPFANQGFKEWHMGFAPTNGVESRFWSTQFTETNADITTSFAESVINWNYKTNATTPAMQWVFQGNGANANLVQFMAPGVVLHWQSPSQQPNMLVADDGTSNPRTLLSWDPGNKRFNLINNGDCQSIQIGADLWFPFNTGIGLKTLLGYQPNWVAASANYYLSSNTTHAASAPLNGTVEFQNLNGNALIYSPGIGTTWQTTNYLNAYVFTNNVPLAANSTLVNANHGLGFIPADVTWVLAYTNSSATTGFVSGDEIDISMTTLGTSTLTDYCPFQTWKNSTKLGISSVSGATFQTVTKTGGSRTTEDMTNVVVKCYVRP